MNGALLLGGSLILSAATGGGILILGSVLVGTSTGGLANVVLQLIDKNPNFNKS